MRARAISLALVALVALVPSAAIAQEATSSSSSSKCGGDSKAGGKGKYERVVRADGTVVYKMKQAFVLCGSVPKPSVLYGLLNTTINYEWENLKQNFLPRVLRSVESSPF